MPSDTPLECFLKNQDGLLMFSQNIFLFIIKLPINVKTDGADFLERSPKGEAALGYAILTGPLVVQVSLNFLGFSIIIVHNREHLIFTSLT